MTDTGQDTQRAGYTAGLRALADLLDTHPELTLPTDGRPFVPLTVGLWGDADAPQQMAAWARALPGTVTKSGDDAYYYLAGQLHGLHVQVTAGREQVCQRIVTGTTIVQRPDPDAPLVEVEVDTVEWECTPLLAEATS